MIKYITKNNMDTKELDCIFEQKDTTKTVSATYYNKKSRNFGKYLLSAGIILSCNVAEANPNIFFNDNNIITESYIENYAKIIDTPLSEYISEINKITKIKTSKRELFAKIISFVSLKNNWDGYGAIPLETMSSINTNEIINQLPENQIEQIDEIGPNPNGTLSISWINNSDEEISVEIGNFVFSYYVKFNSQSPIFVDNAKINYNEINKLSDFVSKL